MMTVPKSHALPNQEKWIKLSRNEVKKIFIYYITFFIISLIVMLLLISYFSASNSQEIEIIAIVLFAFDCGLLGGTFYYIRKLYKSCIQLLVAETEKSSTSIEALGAKIYFYFRPIMGATLSALVILGVYGGFFVLLEQPAINSDKFYVFVAIAAFAIGFSNGKIIVNLDSSTDKVAKMIGGSEGTEKE